ncbi:hypothetical protein O3P69_005438 [Scylla paramamosain]|uniref:Uncharacterized protein n=1 Tax=Scylla paramamosain TaxID=85552 RepID=A0AAW0UDN6_SCYPA
MAARTFAKNIWRTWQSSTTVAAEPPKRPATIHPNQQQQQLEPPQPSLDHPSSLTITTTTTTTTTTCTTPLKAGVKRVESQTRFKASFSSNVNYLKRRFSSGDLSAECDDEEASLRKQEIITQQPDDNRDEDPNMTLEALECRLEDPGDLSSTGTPEKDLKNLNGVSRRFSLRP